MSSRLLRLNTFWGEPANFRFEGHFTPNHNSSADSSTSIGSDLHLSIGSENFPMKTRFSYGSDEFP
ncbi:hypothetical protein ES332_A06G125900v1 [Gossypium tomentosum]|uniref:Uncharacterized protein n=1 Tax=Gossypium tomentosum TaxID=34277 RepID=A0A5D2Q557_GOSTO|nr:hypothetical protein ES332_A06G125900v1 [Gossypium tomentosum]